MSFEVYSSTRIASIEINFAMDNPLSSLTTSTPYFGLESRISTTELRRRFWHIAPGFLPFILWPLSHRDPISGELSFILIAIVVGIAISIIRGYQQIARSGKDKNELSAVVGYAGSVLFTILLFPAQVEIGFVVLAILAFGDGFATLGGMLLRGPTLPWNRKKTFSGLISFILFGGLLASIIYWGESQNLEALNPHASFRTSLQIGMAVAFVAAFVETIPSRINDNIRVGITAAGMGVLMHWLVTGWA